LILADPPGLQVGGALLFSRNAIKTPPRGGEACSRSDRLSGDTELEGGGEVGAEVGAGVEDELDVSVLMM
jgi:hypothetical protein